jgi:hypothetical protein
MAIESMRGFRLTVWRPFAHDRRLARESPGSGGETPLVQADGLYEAIYEWQPRVDVWSSLTETVLTNELRELLVQRFNPYEPPSNRTFAELEKVLARVGEIVSDGKGKWTECELAVDDNFDSDISFRANTIVALQRHLEWLYDVFHNVPGAALTIR